MVLFTSIHLKKTKKKIEFLLDLVFLFPKLNVGRLLVGAIVNLKIPVLMMIPITFKKVKNPGNDVSPFSIPSSSAESQIYKEPH